MEGTRILVGVDGSATSQEALRWALCLGEAFGAEVVAIHALGLLDRWHDPDASARSWRKTLGALVERTWCAPLARSAGAPHTAMSARRVWSVTVSAATLMGLSELPGDYKAMPSFPGFGGQPSGKNGLLGAAKGLFGN